MKIKLAILEEDKAYLNRLMTVFQTKYADKLEVYSFTSKEAAYETLAANKIDIFLASEGFEIDRKDIPSRCGFAYLTESAGIESLRNEQVINKYQRADLIYKHILGIFSENAAEITGVSMKLGEGSKVLAYVSASGGTGASTMAAACVIRFAKMGKKVLYLNLEQFGSADVFFQGEGSGNFGEIIYAIKSKKGNLSLKLESTVKQDASGVFFYSATPMALDMAELSSEEIRGMITNTRMCGEYEYIILDMDFSLEKPQIDILCECNQVIFVNDGSPASNVKLERVMASMQILDEQNEWNLLMRCNILYNRFSSKTSETVEIPDIRQLGGIKRYEGYGVEQLLQELAKIEVFDGLL